MLLIGNNLILVMMSFVDLAQVSILECVVMIDEWSKVCSNYSICCSRKEVSTSIGYAGLATKFSRQFYILFSIMFKSAYIDILIVLLPHFYMGGIVL